VVWGGVWWFWYRDNPAEHADVNQAELTLIERGIREEGTPNHDTIPYVQIVTSANVLLAMFQYAASNITFFISITWLQPYIEDTWGEQFAYAASIPLLCGAVALWFSGSLVTYLHRRGWPVLSRRLPAMFGYSLGAIGLLLCTQTVESPSVWPFIACFSLGIFGVEMTLSPSWAFCMDIGGSRSGAVSGAMNMVGNMGAAVSAVAFPFFVANVTIPVFAETTGTANSFFVFAATMNVLAVVAWLFMNPMRPATKASRGALRARLMCFVAIVLFVISALIYTKFMLPGKAGDEDEQPPAPAPVEVQE
jgi:ACS family glucarate transporter-like MFS transporter